MNFMEDIRDVKRLSNIRLSNYVFVLVFVCHTFDSWILERTVQAKLLWSDSVVCSCQPLWRLGRASASPLTLRRPTRLPHTRARQTRRHYARHTTSAQLLPPIALIGRPSYGWSI